MKLFALNGSVLKKLQLVTRLDEGGWGGALAAIN